MRIFFSFKFNISTCRKDSSSIKEDDIALLKRQFKSYLKNIKENFYWKRGQGKSDHHTKVTNPIYFERKKLHHIKWDCPLIKDNKKVKEEDKNGKRSS